MYNASLVNGSVPTYETLNFSKLNKIEIQIKDHWTKLLKSAVIAMNSTRKKAHGQTAFKVMWGRELMHQDL